MKKLLFFPQNETHIANMVPVAKLLSDKYEIVFLSAEIYFDQYIYENEFEFGKLIVTGEPKGAFYLESALRKVCRVNDFKEGFKALDLCDIEGVIVANDGALQRVVMDFFPNAKKILLLDGIISDYSYSLSDVIHNSESKFHHAKDYFRRLFRLLLAGVLNYLPYKEYLPSEIGSYKFDVAFTLSEYVNSILRERKSPIQKYRSVGLPRYQEMLSLERCSKGREVPRVLFITQGYVWHNEVENDELQHREISRFIELVKNNYKSIDVAIRVHPRDKIENYRRYVGGNVCIEESSVSLKDSILESKAVFGFNSTVLLEAAWYGVPSFSVMTSGQFWRFKRSFLGHKGMSVVTDSENLHIKLENIFKEINNKNLVSGIFNPITNTTAEDIASDILKELT